MRNKNFNFRVLEDLVATKYGDMTGIIQIDGHTALSELYNLCENHGILRKDYVLIGFGFSDFKVDGVGSDGKADCSVLLLETAKYGTSHDEILTHLQNNHTVDVIKKTFTVNYIDMCYYIKRVDVMMLTDLGNHFNQINIINDSE